ncbi:MAG: hypothetical protein ABIH23_30635 [bacterium]
MNEQSLPDSETSDTKPDEVVGNPDPLPGVWRELGDLPEGAVVTEVGLARIFQRHPTSIRRAVRRKELPPPTKLLGGPIWTVGAILAHIEQRLEVARKESERTARKVQQLQP